MKYRLFELLSLIFVAVIVVITIRIFLFQTFKIPSGSMDPTLEVGDRIIINKLVYGLSLPGIKGRVLALKKPKRGDVVVFYRFSEYEDIDAERHYVKRIVGIPGDKVEVKSFLTYVNDQLVDLSKRNIKAEELATVEGAVESFGPIQLEDSQYFVMGDNQTNSKDSRFYGPINLSDIEGRVMIVFWSWNETTPNLSVRWDRVGRRVR